MNYYNIPIYIESGRRIVDKNENLIKDNSLYIYPSITTQSKVDMQSKKKLKYNSKNEKIMYCKPRVYNSKNMRQYHQIKQPGIDIQRKTR